MLRLAALCGAVYGRARPTLIRLARWAAGRQISPNTLSGVSVLLALCAAIWISGGSADRAAGTAALAGSLLAMIGSGRLAAFMAGGSWRTGAADRDRDRDRNSTDWLALPDVSDPAEATGQDAGGLEEPGTSARLREYGWMTAVCAVAAESAIYGGMAAGGAAGGLTRMWPLAVLTVVSAGTADLLGACRLAGPGAPRSSKSGGEIPAVTWTDRLPALPPSARLMLAGLTFAFAGPQDALYAVLAANALALACMVVTLGRIAPAQGTRPGRRARQRRGRQGSKYRPGGAAMRARVSRKAAARTESGGTGGETKVTAVVGVAGPAGTSAVRIITSARAAARARDSSGADAAGQPEADEVGESGGQGPGPDAGPADKAGGAGPGPDAGPAGEVGGDGRDAHADSEEEAVEPIPVGGMAGTARPVHRGPAWASGSVGSRRSGETDGDSPAAGLEPPAVQDEDDGEPGARRGTPGGAGSGYAASPRSADRPDVLALRDDGAAALWAGRLVQGNLIPLPPALAGLIATAMLAALGLRDLHGFIAVTPPIVMMLAAPGSSHPHDGRFDWLVPALLALAQYVYLGALGFAVSVPGPVIFSACALTALWYASLAAGGRRRGTAKGAGWEVRLFVTGLAVTFGLGVFGYLGLAAYLGVLLIRQAATRYLPRVEDDRQ